MISLPSSDTLLFPGGFSHGSLGPAGKPMRPGTSCKGQKVCLVLPIVLTIGHHGVGSTHLGRHGLRRLRPRNLGNCCRRMGIEPEDVILAGMGPAREAVPELCAESHPEITQPHVLKEARASPQGGRMLHVPDRHVSGLSGQTARGTREVRCHIEHPMSRIKELGSLKDHLHHMLIAMPARASRRLLR